MRTSAAPSSGQSTFWSSRRSIRRITNSPISAHGHLLEEDGLVDLPRDRGRDLAALAAAAPPAPPRRTWGSSTGANDGEPRVVLALGGVALRDGLGGPGLARDLEAGHARRDPGAVLDHDGERVAQEGPDRPGTDPPAPSSGSTRRRRACRPRARLAGPAAASTARRRWRRPPSSARPGAASPAAAPCPIDMFTVSPDSQRLAARGAGPARGHQPEALAAQVDAGGRPRGRRPARTSRWRRAPP